MEYTSKLRVVPNDDGFLEIWDEGEFWRFKQKILLPSESYVLREYFINEYKRVPISECDDYDDAVENE